MKVTRKICRGNQEHCTQVFRKVDKEWVLKKETEGMLFAAIKALRTSSMKAKIDKQPVSSKCRLCGIKEETVIHLVSGFPSWHRNSTKEDMSMLTEEFIGNCARSMDWKAQTGGMNIHLLRSWIIMK